MKAKLLKRLRKEAKQTIYMVRKLTLVDCSTIEAKTREADAQEDAGRDKNYEEAFKNR